MIQVAPRWGAGIEIAIKPSKTLGTKSLPAGERGLKFNSSNSIFI